MKTNLRSLCFILCMGLLIFQSPLEQAWSGFTYLDELAGLFWIPCVLLERKRRKFDGRFLPLIGFAMIGLLGDIIYQYQGIGLVLADLYTNLKFYFAILSGYYFLRQKNDACLRSNVLAFLKLITLFLFAFTILDLIFNIYPPQYRYGIRCVSLFFAAPTYFVGALVLVIALFTAFYTPSNNIYIFLDLFMMVMTLRGKAIAGAALYLFVFIFFMHPRKKIKWQHIAIMAVLAIVIGWNQISFYFVELSGRSARSVILLTAIVIMKDYFPIGTGFAAYGSHFAAVNYSPVYVKYGFNDVWELSSANPHGFFSDHFWPIIMGQTGVAGLFCYLCVLKNLWKEITKLKETFLHGYYAAIFIMAYLLIASTAEPAFNNSVSIGLALLLGYLFYQGKKMSKVYVIEE